jgi:hypothetical protein
MGDVEAAVPAVERRRWPRRSRHHEGHVGWKHIAFYVPVVLLVIFLGGLALWSFIERQSLVIVPEPVPRVTIITGDAASPLAAAWVRLLNAAAIETTVVPLEEAQGVRGVVAFCDVKTVPAGLRSSGIAVLGTPPSTPIGTIELSAETGTSDNAFKLSETASPILARLNPGVAMAARPGPVAFLTETPQMHIDARWKTSARAALMHMEVPGGRVLWVGLQPDALPESQTLLLMLRTAFRWLGGQPISDGSAGEDVQANNMSAASRRVARNQRFTFSVERVRDRGKFAVQMENRGERKITNPTVQLWLPPGVRRVQLGGDWIMKRGATVSSDRNDGTCTISLPSLRPNEERVLKLEAE